MIELIENPKGTTRHHLFAEPPMCLGFCVCQGVEGAVMGCQFLPITRRPDSKGPYDT